MDLVNKFWNFCHTLRHEGVDYSDYIEELTYLIFLKIAEERGIAIPEGCSWNDLIVHDKEDLLIKYNKVLNELSMEKSILGNIFSQPMAKIRSSKSLKRLLTLIDEVNWSSYDEDVLGSMFEGLLEKAANESKKGAGQYFTPRPLIDSIVTVMRPDPFESPIFKMSDVACGTAGFIISSYEWIKKKNSVKALSEQKLSKLYNDTYFGQELVTRPRRMAQMNLFLHGISPNIKLGDTIYEPFDNVLYNCILTNPPFGNKGSNQIPERKDFSIKTSNKQLNFIQHVISSLVLKGRTAIVLPDNVLSDEKAVELWKVIMPECNVHTILKLPNGTFLPYANVKAVVIFIQKGVPTKNIWIYDARSNVESITKKGRPLTHDHFKNFIKSYGDEPNGTAKRTESDSEQRFRKFTVDQIAKRNYNLDINWISDNQNLENEYFEIEDITSEAIIELEAIIESLKELSNMLENNNE
ncbi:class I SAM-dependent DNA methyltransferase [Flavobacterium subsaxonicum]|uniref:site-specific DNA-methyltransferase (adenine-specific) n=1 Tax=Flavobacterium subsaxonicum WB 4.1-42 = DSM 21790 TaxID=1121898 RepID=A0A0A2MFG0_9FLAO|nr:N-6 DNA methylase [Flavobacterium subsaxonicum]KGO91024.1 restriction endonuclease subunit S [Flavobacterium subsaxonicum WB 4.1-42 = DSM 21790]